MISILSDCLSLTFIVSPFCIDNLLVRAARPSKSHVNNWEILGIPMRFQEKGDIKRERK